MKDNLDNRRIADRDGGKISKQREIEFGIASVYRAISLSRYRHSLIFLSLLFFFLFLRFHYSVLHTSRFSIRRQMSVCLEIDLHIYIYIQDISCTYIYIYISVSLFFPLRFFQFDLNWFAFPFYIPFTLVFGFYILIFFLPVVTTVPATLLCSYLEDQNPGNVWSPSHRWNENGGTVHAAGSARHCSLSGTMMRSFVPWTN